MVPQGFIGAIFREMKNIQTGLEKLELLHKIVYSSTEKETWINSLQQLLEYRAEVAKHFLKSKSPKDYSELIDYCNEQIKKLLIIW